MSRLPTMKRPAKANYATRIAMTIVTAVVAGLVAERPGFRADAQSDDPRYRMYVAGLASAEAGGFVDECGIWTHETDLGFIAIEATRGFTFCGPVTVAVAGGEITLPQADGITWGFGDTGQGYGLEIVLPGKSTLFFDAHQTVVIMRAESDRALIEEIIATAPEGFERVEREPTE